ncbi:MAG: DUF1003 domain-containing protein [Candidatus Pacebacteria bacterium]|nr:DUF1003 domain-containing protein [Candidatus Paceibacterota bacterium]
MNKKIPHSLEYLKSLRKPILNTAVESKTRLRPLEKFAVWITQHVGTMGFFGIIFFWTIIWLGWNVLAPAQFHFDPYPAFVFWLFISNLVQLMLMPLIMLGQNLQGKHADMRAEADFELNTRAEREIETILLHLENQSELILKILHNLEKTENKIF